MDTNDIGLFFGGFFIGMFCMGFLFVINEDTSNYGKREVQQQAVELGHGQFIVEPKTLEVKFEWKNK